MLDFYSYGQKHCMICEGQHRYEELALAGAVQHGTVSSDRGNRSTSRELWHKQEYRSFLQSFGVTIPIDRKKNSPYLFFLSTLFFGD